MAADESATKIERLDAALAALDAAVARVTAADRSRADLVETLAVMDDDRQKLATDLDAALFRANGLDAAAAAVETRLRAVDREVAALLRTAG